MINISKILKDAPQGMKLYSPLFGEVEFCAVDTADGTIVVRTEHGDKEWFSITGKYKINKSHFLYSDSECLLFPSKECRDWETWLLPTKPMFKVGDWVVDQTFAGPEGYIGEVGIIEGVTMFGDVKKENYYTIRGILCGTDRLVCEYYLRPWTIQDAKDGDVLSVEWHEENGHVKKDGSTKLEKIVIFKSVSKQGVEGYGCTFVNGKLAFSDIEVPYYSKTWTDNLHPATKEQRDLLFAKMKEVGYEWDADKKELKKIRPHYGIKNFKPFDKVLTRDTKHGNWNVNLFSYYIDDNDARVIARFRCMNSLWIQCIPFNDDTEHLLGTTDTPDEQYINW